MRYRKAAYAESTKAVYRSQLRSYVAFCDDLGYTTVPASEVTVCRYVAHLAKTHKPNSIRQYLNVIRLIHLESGLQSPLQDCWMVKTLLQGVKREKGGKVNRKLPITLGMLQSVAARLDLSVSQQLTFWSACLISFFGMMRKSSLFPRGQHSSDHMTVQHCIAYDWGIAIGVEYSKTIQCRERQAFIALPWHQTKLLCPARTLIRSLAVAECQEECAYVFSYRDGGRLVRMTYALFTSMLRRVLIALGLPLQSYSGHSFRRGGATYALNCGIAPETIKAQGDWKSLSYLDYLNDTDVADRASLLKPMYKE